MSHHNRRKSSPLVSDPSSCEHVETKMYSAGGQNSTNRLLEICNQQGISTKSEKSSFSLSGIQISSYDADQLTSIRTIKGIFDIDSWQAKLLYKIEKYSMSSKSFYILGIHTETHLKELKNSMIGICDTEKYSQDVLVVQKIIDDLISKRSSSASPETDDDNALEFELNNLDDSVTF
ncbi:uncharacterized protein I206_107460 [Kwoniella pini CBS 10737]|uniref:Uncharacterized protein n=1 Tax=Kwoniella pini CBS 10737 TaxID=1296096 RepID=A0A1B9HXC4_9TREE|nr:uncharacterized protein I206_05789 [Kwoniella pini CBS 10737]OCF47925.1 hypothetical protein I206_05789 [Kwoniella pini CBS 10737]